MKTAAISVLKASLSEFLDRVRAGEEILITDRGKPIAKLVPLAYPSERKDARFQELVRAGMVREGSGKIPKGVFTRDIVADPKAYARKALLDEREEGL